MNRTVNDLSLSDSAMPEGKVIALIFFRIPSSAVIGPEVIWQKLLVSESLC